MKIGKAVAGACLWLSIVGLLIIGTVNPSSVGASGLTNPALGVSDGAMVGNVVALPINAATALFHNPAHLSLLPNQMSVGGLGIRFHPTYENNRGYDSRSRELPIAPNIGFVTDAFAPLQFGIGMYGALALTFNHSAEPEHGVPNNFYTELLSISLAPAVSYSLLPNLHIGVAVNPTYGRFRLKSPTPVGRLDVDVRGPGIFGTLGVQYQPTDRLSLGLTYKTRGKIWMFGNARVGGGGDDVQLNFNIPQNVKFGFAYKVTDRLTMTGQARWTQLSVFQDTRMRFDERTFLNQNAVSAAKDRWRLGVGLQYEIFDGVKLRYGFSYEPWAIKDRALSPLLADNTDYMNAFGISVERSRWIIDIGGGFTHTKKRRADVKENPLFPGRYSLDFPVFGFQVTRLLGPSDETMTDGTTSSLSMASSRNYKAYSRRPIARPSNYERPGVMFARGRDGEALLDAMIKKLAAKNDPIMVARARPANGLLDSLISRLSANRCILTPNKRSRTALALSDRERRQWCKSGETYRPA